MKREELLDAIGNISSETVERNAISADNDNAGQDTDGEQPHSSAADERKRHWRVIAGTLAAAAAVLIVIIAGGLHRNQNLLRREPLAGAADDSAGQSFNAATAEAGTAAEAAVEDVYDEAVCETAADEPTYTAEAEEAEEEMEYDQTGKDMGQGEEPKSEMASGAPIGDSDLGEYVNIYELLSKEKEGEIENVQRIAQVKIGQYMAQYEWVPEALGDRLKNSLGLAVAENEGWYRVSGHEEFHYLINVSGEEYTLWRFIYFLADEYPYRDVLTTIYNVASADEIELVVLNAADMDNTDAGQKLQKEIGTSYITNTSDLQKLFDILWNMTCYGSNHWELIDYGASDEGMLYSVRMGRYLDLYLKNRGGDENIGIKERIDTDKADIGFSVKYTAVSGMFYEYGGVAYNRLSAQDKATVDRILGIVERWEED